MRESVREFAESMESILQDNDYKTGWSGLSIIRLINMLKCEVRELEEAFNNCEPDELVKEATDIANFCMMIHENITQRNKK
jgi:hypothetical protein